MRTQDLRTNPAAATLQRELQARQQEELLAQLPGAKRAAELLGAEDRPVLYIVPTSPRRPVWRSTQHTLRRTGS